MWLECSCTEAWCIRSLGLGLVSQEVMEVGPGGRSLLVPLLSLASCLIIVSPPPASAPEVKPATMRRGSQGSRQSPPAPPLCGGMVSWGSYRHRWQDLENIPNSEGKEHKSPGESELSNYEPLFVFCLGKERIWRDTFQANKSTCEC